MILATEGTENTENKEMANELNKILISYKEVNFKRKLYGFLTSKVGLSHFGPGSENRQKVEKILDKVVETDESRVRSPGG